MDIKKIGMVGAGSMGSMMSLLYAEKGLEVHFFDPAQHNCDALLKEAKQTGLDHAIFQAKDHKALCQQLDSPKVFMFSIPHGEVADKTIKALQPYLEKGDVIMDASNEDWRNTERRQRDLEPLGIHYVGMGVSGGYQSARSGPSMSPGGTKDALDAVMPFLRKVAAKDKKGRSCVEEIGPGGSGHYVKMVHNGIEQGMMSALCEAWGIMVYCLGMDYAEIAKVFSRWSEAGPLRGNFLITIGADICTQRNPKDNGYELSKIKDKVVQDADGTEGTGYWTLEESFARHISMPTPAAAHYFRLSSAYLNRREAIVDTIGREIKPQSVKSDDATHEHSLSMLEDAIYFSFLCSFVQGLHLIHKISGEQDWNLDFQKIMQIWRAGCIISSDYIVDLIDEVYSVGEYDGENLLASKKIGSELLQRYKKTKDLVLFGISNDAAVPAISASLEYFKYNSSLSLPTQFMEAELDYFGEHMFDLKSEIANEPKIGSHHFEWKPAKGLH